MYEALESEPGEMTADCGSGGTNWYSSRLWSVGLGEKGSVWDESVDGRCSSCRGDADDGISDTLFAKSESSLSASLPSIPLIASELRLDCVLASSADAGVAGVVGAGDGTSGIRDIRQGPEWIFGSGDVI